jgi:hypothetical protein
MAATVIFHSRQAGIDQHDPAAVFDDVEVHISMRDAVDVFGNVAVEHGVPS